MRYINLPNKKYYIKLVIRNDPENRDGSKNTHKQLNDIRILIHYIPDTYMRAFRYTFYYKTFYEHHIKVQVPFRETWWNPFSTSDYWPSPRTDSKTLKIQRPLLNLAILTEPTPSLPPPLAG